MRLCLSCHREVDGRSVRRWATSPTARPCQTCGRVADIRSHGRCNRCAEFLRRTGREWDGTYQRGKPKTVERVRPCSECGRTILIHAHGLCGACYARQRKESSGDTSTATSVQSA